MNLFILFVSYIFIIKITSEKNAHSSTILSKNNIISQNNLKIDGDFIPLNPINTKTLTTYGFADKHRNIFHLKITNKKVIPLDVFNLKYLVRLEIDNTCFYPCDYLRIPPDIERLQLLTELKIENTKITRLPEQLGKLKNLKKLILTKNGLMSLPDSMGNLSSLVTLCLQHNNLRTLPNTMKNLQKLEKIFLSNNSRLRSIEPLNGLPSLELVDTTKCRIKTLPQNLPLLWQLYMSNNRLISLDGIEKLGYGTDNGKHFHFNGNYINFIPTEIDEVKNLVELNLNDNQLNYMPYNICRIPTLKYLCVWNKCFNGDEIISQICVKF